MTPIDCEHTCEYCVVDYCMERRNNLFVSGSGTSDNLIVVVDKAVGKDYSATIKVDTQTGEIVEIENESI
jgi:hypothetical protein